MKLTSSHAFSIGRLSATTSVNLETVRYYEKIGLLPRPPRSMGGHRMYGQEHIKRLVFVRRARELGFTLEEVRALLHLAEDRHHSCAKARTLASEHLAEVRSKLVDLRRMERVLSETVARCADGTRPECPLLEALFEPNVVQGPVSAVRRSGSADGVRPEPAARSRLRRGFAR